MLTSMRRRFAKQWFNSKCGGILSTPRLEPKDSTVTIVSMVSHNDLVMYLVSVKSFYRQFGEGRIIVLDDGTLTNKDKALLSEHLPLSQIVPASDISTGMCPQYISWKRLLFIAETVKDGYIIQLDSDLLTLNSIREVAQCVRENRSFILGTWNNQRIEPMKFTCDLAKTVESQHVQTMAERNFDKLTDFERLRYVRGCAGFSGFARGSLSRETVEDFSRKMQEIIGSTWREWGSEQTTCNYLVANSAIATVLPFPKYSGYRPGRKFDGASLLHFSGTHRFKEGVYVRLAYKLIRELRG
jgi:hypothetical protein